MIDAGDVFNPQDFDSIRLVLQMQNLTTRTEVKDPKEMSLVEIANRALVLEVPAKSCNIKHNVMVKISRIDSHVKRPIELLGVTGKICELEDVGEGCLRIIVDCVQCDEESWNRLLAIYSVRQEDIEKFFSAAKGY